jgi:ubiquinone/menaquinone biosynthesis C-methylase UbiE
MTETFQLSIDQAQAYDELFVPALFAQWAPTILDCARVRPGQRVLDVGCGTGLVACAAEAVVGPTGAVTGLDLNPAMLAIARRKTSTVDWRQGNAQDLPFESGRFDAVVCQSALFFFAEPQRALKEMARVTAPDGHVAVQTYAGLEEQPAYGPFVAAVARRAGAQARSLLGTYWSQGDVSALERLMTASRLDVVETRTTLGTVAFASVDAVMHTEIQATPLADRIDPDTYRTIIADTREALREYVAPTGEAALPIRAIFVAGRRHGGGR